MQDIHAGTGARAVRARAAATTSSAGTPTAGVYWAGNVINGAPPFRARHRPLLSFRTACPRCGADCMAPDGGCDHDDSFVADVPAADAVAAARALTARAPVPA